MIFFNDIRTIRTNDEINKKVRFILDKSLGEIESESQVYRIAINKLYKNIKEHKTNGKNKTIRTKY